MITAITDIGSRRELFVDSFLVESLNGARLKLQEPKPGGVLSSWATTVCRTEWDSFITCGSQKWTTG